MKLRRIEVFLAVAARGSFSAAAAKLCIAQSAVSVAIRDLEDELGARLFVRGARRVTLTRSGELLLARAEPALRQLGAVADEIRDLERLAIGEVRIAAPAIVTQYLLARPLAAFVGRHPGLRLRVRQGGAREIEALVISRDVDLGIVATRPFPPELDSRVLQEVANVAFMAAGSPLAALAKPAWRDVLGEPLALFPSGYHQRALVEHHAERLKMTLRIVLEAENPAVLLEAVRAGLAVTTLPAPAAEGIAGIRGAPLPDREGDRLSIAAVWLKAVPLAPAAGALLAELGDALAPPARARRRAPRQRKVTTGASNR